jgi:hypothetical protein
MATTTINENVTIKGLDDMHQTVEIKPLDITLRPIELETRSELAVTQPIVTNATTKGDTTAKLNLAIEPLRVESDQKSAIDIKPLAIDACQTIKLAPLPATCVEQPYQHHFGLTFMGMELFGFNLTGKSEMALRSPERQQFHRAHTGGEHHRSPEPPPDRSVGNAGGGLRVRVGRT